MKPSLKLPSVSSKVKPEKLKKKHSKKSYFIFLYFEKWNYLALILKNFLYFIQRIFSSISGNENPPKMFVPGNGNPKKTYISGSNFLSLKNKKTHSKKLPYISGNGTF